MGINNYQASQMLPPESRASLRFAILVILGVLLAQFLLVSITFPLGELFSQKPLFHIDAAWHWYHIKVAEQLFRDGRIVGYDPTFNAGYPGGVTFNWSGKLPAVLTILLHRWLDQIIVYKLYSFASAILGPACLPLALYLFRLRRGEILVGSLFGMILWWASMFRWYHTAGMVSFVAASYISLPYLAKILQYLNEGGGTASLVGLGIIGAVVWFWHPLFPIPIALGTVVYLLTYRRDLDSVRTLKLLAIVPSLALLPNLIWLYPMYHFQRVFAAGIPDIGPYGKLVIVSNLWRELGGIWSGTAHGSKLYAPLALASVWAWSLPERRLAERASRTLILLAITLNLLADLGGAVPGLRFSQPNRFAPAGYLFLCVPASVGVFAIWRCAKAATATRVAWAARISFAVLALAVIYSANEVRQEVSWTHVGHYGAPPPEVRDLGELSQWVLNWLGSDTSAQGRVLFETSNGRIHDGAHMAGYYAFTAGREFIGGPYPFTNFAGSWDGTAFGKPIGQIPKSVFAEYLDLYNIGWILVHSAEAKRYLDQLPGVVQVGRYGVLNAYRCQRPLTYFVVGSGEVLEQRTNRLVLGSLSGRELVIKYHFVPGLTSDPPATILPIWLMDDPNPFIRILNPPNQIRLSM